MTAIANVNGVLAAFASAPMIARQVIYPANGQSAAQQQRMKPRVCAWAKQQTGYDPVQSTRYAAPPPQQKVGGERSRGL